LKIKRNQTARCRQQKNVGQKKSPSRLAGLIFLPTIFLLSAAHNLVAFNFQRL
jgi:hypothetical protein